MSGIWRVRPETAADLGAVRAVHVAAFPSSLESRLVDALRAAGKATISLVAEDTRGVVGHVLFTEVSVASGPRRALGLAPVAVLPHAQRRAAGSQLIAAGLARAAALGYDFVVVLGEPDYYRRFGFSTASRSDSPTTTAPTSRSWRSRCTRTDSAAPPGSSAISRSSVW